MTDKQLPAEQAAIPPKRVRIADNASTLLPMLIAGIALVTVGMLLALALS
ncbi:MAG: hypothetical protein K2X57_13220 [Xanthobacteraceae bacterium]|nr:hypothetical protein [Xanthobacteraceae bacterium]